MGQCWRDEMEIGDLRELVTKLYSDVKYLYTLLHAFVRHKLEKFYGMKFQNGLIPSHLLGKFQELVRLEYMLHNNWIAVK